MDASLPPFSLSPTRLSRLKTGLHHLQEAAVDANEANKNKWEFALTAQALFASGLRESDLRWLVSFGLAEQAREQIPNRNGERIFEPLPSLSIAVSSCFILSKAAMNSRSI